MVVENQAFDQFPAFLRTSWQSVPIPGDRSTSATFCTWGLLQNVVFRVVERRGVHARYGSGDIQSLLEDYSV